MISIYFAAALLAFGTACLWLYIWATVWDKLRLPARFRLWRIQLKYERNMVHNGKWFNRKTC